MGAQLAQMGMGVSDAVMAGQYNSADLAGVALGGSLLWPVMLLIMGLIQAVTPTVAQLNGSRDYAEIGEVIRQGLWMALVGGLVGVLILNNIGPVYELLDVDPALTWAQRLKRVFNIDISVCPLCGGTMRVIADITDPDIIQKILDHIEAQLFPQSYSRSLQWIVGDGLVKTRCPFRDGSSYEILSKERRR